MRRILLLTALALALGVSGCVWWLPNDENRIRVVNESDCRLWITIEDDEEGWLDPGETMVVKNVDDGRHYCEAYLDEDYDDRCDTYETDNLNGDESDTWYIDDPDCDEC